MPSNKKRRIRERRTKTGESYTVAKRQLDAATSPTLPPVRSEFYDADGRRVPDQRGLPKVEVVDLMDFDGANLDTAWVPETAFDDPSMPRKPGWSAQTKRVLTLAEYIKLRERQTGWKLYSLTPHAPFMGIFLTAILSWDTRTKRERGEP